MKLEIYDENKPVEKPVKFKLDMEDGSLFVSAADGDGSLSSLLFFNQKGELHICAGVNNSLGFVLDDQHRLVPHKRNTPSA